MALNKETLTAAINTAIKSATAPAAGTADISAVRATDLATAIADAVETYIKSATVTIPTGAIIVVGGATTQSNVAPILLTGSLS